jgi:uncharacterized protein (DUF3084 family)
VEQIVNFFTGLWTNGKVLYKVLFVILIPLVIAAFGVKIFLSYNVEAAKKEIKEADDKNTDLKTKQDKLNEEANKVREEANNLGKQTGKNNEDVNWYKKQ